MAYGSGDAAVPPSGYVPVGTPWPPAPAAEPRRSTSAVWAVVLGMVGLATAPLLGGVVPGVLAVVLATRARREIRASGGWLTGGGHADAGRVLGWVAVGVAVTVATVLLARGLLAYGEAAVNRTFPSDVE